MPIDLTSKLYVQLAPDELGVAYLQSLQVSLPNSARIVPAQELHMSIIHIGLLEKLCVSLGGHAVICESLFLHHAQLLARQLEELTRDFHPIALMPASEALYGKTQSTLVVKFASDPRLEALHRDSLAIFMNFLYSLDLPDLERIISRDYNLQHTQSLLPHITLAKSSTAASPFIPTKSASLSMMPIVYEQ